MASQKVNAFFSLTVDDYAQQVEWSR
eukprot:COSAG06_NODE_708_length_12893_cov_10.008676_17_plen_25_part_01